MPLRLKKEPSKRKPVRENGEVQNEKALPEATNDTASEDLRDEGQNRAIEAITGEPVTPEDEEKGEREEDEATNVTVAPLDEEEARSIQSITSELVTREDGNDTGSGRENASLTPTVPMRVEVLSDPEDEEEKPLTDEEKDDLVRLEGEVDQSLFRAALALKEIRDRRLYRATHTNFKDYCRERFDFGSSYSFALVNAATIFQNIEKSPRSADFLLPKNPYQLRPLEKLKDDPERQAETWLRAVERSEGKQPTFRAVKEAVDEVINASTTTKENDLVAALSEVEFFVVRHSSDPRLSDRNGYWGRIEDMDADGNITVTLYDRTVENVSSSDLSPIRGTKKEVRQREKLLQRLQTIHEGISKDDRGVVLLMRHFGTLKVPVLSPIEEDVLKLLERKARSHGKGDDEEGAMNEERALTEDVENTSPVA